MSAAALRIHEPRPDLATAPDDADDRSLAVRLIELVGPSEAVDRMLHTGRWAWVIGANFERQEGGRR